MVVAHVSTVAFHGIEAREVDVQVHMASGLPTFTVVGLPDKAVGESRERVSAALGALAMIAALYLHREAHPRDLNLTGTSDTSL